jgi:2,4-dienoyl-CoA reductase-like NADH-dependent reductase (Old Yellow Enzyme family)/thioredoxin reductase
MIRHLFTPYRIKKLELKNRIVMAPLASFLIEKEGWITEKTIEHYRLRAAGGPAMVIMEACAVSPEGIVSHHQARIDDDRLLEGLSRIARVMKSEGAVPALQLHHGGRQTSSKVIGRRPLAPSALPCPTIRGEVEPLSVRHIQDIVKKFGDAAVRARDAGFELVEIHGAHGYLVNQFLSRFSNIREDEYGGDVAARTRFSREIVEEIRKRVGDDFPLSFKISAQEFVPDGLTVPESIEILKILIEAGIDIIQVSAGNDATAEWICQPMFMKKACLVDSAERIRKTLNFPVMAVGRINNPILADDIIGKDMADLVCMGRGLLADPELPRKAQEGRLDEIRTCIACNTCMESIFRRGRVECLVNPMLGREKEMAFVPAAKRKKVMVVGGGPGGLNVAWVAAKRGHEVHLYEKQSELGGQLIAGSVSDYKKELVNLIRFQKTQIEKFGVRCVLNCRVTPQLVDRERPDVLVLATGSLPYLPPAKGIERNMVLPFTQVLNGRAIVPTPSVVIGGGPTGCEVALHLAENGSLVTIVEMLPEIAKNLESMTRKLLLNRIKEKNIATLTEYSLSRVEENGVVVVNKAGEEKFLEANRVVIAVGTRPDNTLYEQLKSMGYEIHQIGDCLEPRSAKAAILEGALLGRAI